MKKILPLKLISQQSGLSPHVVRIWEKRYAAISPKRSEGNQRLYDEEDLKRLQLLSGLTKNGHTIAKIAKLNLIQLQDLAQKTSSLILNMNTPSNTTLKPEEILESCLEAIKKLDKGAFTKILDEASIHFSLLKLIENILVPLIHSIGNLWHEGELRVTHEHFATLILREHISALNASFPSSSSSKIVISTPAGQVHELGALLVSKIAENEGWQTYYLGNSLPAEELAMAVKSLQAKVLALSIVYPKEDKNLKNEIIKILKLVPEDVRVVFGGSAATTYSSLIQKKSGLVCKNLSEFKKFLHSQ